MPDPAPDIYSASDGLDWRLRLVYGMNFGRTKIVKRPSWLHPFKRVLWVHHHGRVPEIRIRQADPRTLAKITNITA